MQRSLALTALALAIAVVISHAGIVLGGDTWDDLAYHTDVAPPRLAAATEIARADVPAWWDGAGLGVPLLGEPAHGALAPTMWPAHTPRALDALLVLHLWWAALGVAAWARRRGATELAGIGAGLLVASSGVLASAAIRGALPALAMLPWLGAAAAALADAEDRAARARAALGVGAALGAIALAGQLAVLADAVVLACAVGSARGARRWLVAGIAAGLAIGAAQWVPAALQLPLEVGAPRVTGLPLARLVELIAPGRFVRDGAALPSVFAGAALLALARPGRREGVAIAIVAVLALVAGRGGWPAWTGAPALHLAAAVAIAAGCAADGLDRALTADRRAARALLVGAVATVACAIAAAVSHPGASAARDGAVAGVCLAAAAWVAWRERGGWAAPVVLALVLVPSMTALPDTAPTTSRAPVETAPDWASAAIAATPRGTVATPVRFYRPQPFVLAGGAKVDTIDVAAATLAGELAARYGLAQALTQDPARSPADARVWLASASEGGALLDRYGIGIAILPTVMVHPRGFRALGERAGQSLVALPVSPIAAVAHGWRWTGADTDALALLFPVNGGMLLPRGTVVLRGAGDSRSDPRPASPCDIGAWRDGDIELMCDGGSADAYAVVSSSAAPGWSVTIDGTAATPVVADVLRRAVALPAGRHAVRWTYAAPGFAAGAAIGGGGVLGLLALFWASRRRGPLGVS